MRENGREREKGWEREGEGGGRREMGEKGGERVRE